MGRPDALGRVPREGVWSRPCARGDGASSAAESQPAAAMSSRRVEITIAAVCPAASVAASRTSAAWYADPRPRVPGRRAARSSPTAVRRAATTQASRHPRSPLSRRPLRDDGSSLRASSAPTVTIPKSSAGSCRRAGTASRARAYLRSQALTHPEAAGPGRRPASSGDRGRRWGQLPATAAGDYRRHGRWQWTPAAAHRRGRPCIRRRRQAASQTASQSRSSL
jgi:hypothetical protein